MKDIKFRAGKYLIPGKLGEDKDYFYIRFKFNRKLIEEIKNLDGAKWDPNKKIWTVKNNAHNRFQLDYLQGGNPYAPFDIPLIEVKDSWRPLYSHQKEMIAQALTRHYCILACEMGSGKTLAAIEILERISGLKSSEVWYVGPRSGVKAVGLELDKWKAKIRPKMMTYEELVKQVNNWEDGKPSPRVVIFDESSRVKTPTAQRTQAAQHLADSVREEWGDKGYVIEMSGTPAPKAPTDWFAQAEISQPGFLKEGNYHKFKRQLSVIEQRESLAGGAYPHLVTWLDDPNKCKFCGKYKEDENHASYKFGESDYHEFQPSRDEISYLYKRLQGLVLVKFLKDCVDLPEKQYRTIQLKPSADTLRVAKTISKTASRAIQSLNLLRQLSDGFQYQDESVGNDTCSLCNGTGYIKAPVIKEEYDDPKIKDLTAEAYEERNVLCDNCAAIGTVPRYQRGAEEFHTPKDDTLKEYLGDLEDIGRIIIWAGFTGSVDKIARQCMKNGWSVLRVDGRGYHGFNPEGEMLDSDILLKAMDGSYRDQAKLKREYGKVAFVGHPKAGGMALTLTASPVEIFYSNSFDGEARMQAEARAHRVGMDQNRGLTIVDLIHLPTDKLVLDNLKQKKDLQNMTLGEVQAAMEG